MIDNIACVTQLPYLFSDTSPEEHAADRTFTAMPGHHAAHRGTVGFVIKTLPTESYLEVCVKRIMTITGIWAGPTLSMNF